MQYFVNFIADYQKSLACLAYSLESGTTLLGWSIDHLHFLITFAQNRPTRLPRVTLQGDSINALHSHATKQELSYCW